MNWGQMEAKAVHRNKTRSETPSPRAANDRDISKEQPFVTFVLTLQPPRSEMIIECEDRGKAWVGIKVPTEIC
jgi:hypothetical protein